MSTKFAVSISLCLTVLISSAQFPTNPDSLRGSLNEYRNWWDVTGYSIHVQPDFAAKSIQGETQIFFDVKQAGQLMQVDLQQPLIVDSMSLSYSTETGGEIATMEIPVTFDRTGNIIMVKLEVPVPSDCKNAALTIQYHGTPREATNPPWDGGWIWKTDSKGNPWMSVACQGLGASVWYPCKDHQSDEPDQGAELHIRVPDSLVAVGNGRLTDVMEFIDGTKMYSWEVKNPINNYNIIPYIGKYEHIADSIQGLDGKLTLDYWVLEGNVEKATKHFEQVKPMMACFEDWFGPYPFYEDGYKLVESPHLGMEHQSAVAYGNAYKMGYRGRDLSGSGIGLQFDFIIIHESGHEWFGNNITTADIADMWIHEGFTAYSETVYAECLLGKEKAGQYVRGTRSMIRNDKAIIGPYGVNKEGSGDMYYKGANLLHMIRFYMGDDDFKKALHDMNVEFRHSVVTSTQIEQFLNERSEMDLTPIFDQYLREREMPKLEYKVEDKKLHIRLRNCLDDFALQIPFTVDGEEFNERVGRDWLIVEKKIGKKPIVEIERDLLVKVKEVPSGRL